MRFLNLSYVHVILHIYIYYYQLNQLQIFLFWNFSTASKCKVCLYQVLHSTEKNTHTKKKNRLVSWQELVQNVICYIETEHHLQPTSKRWASHGVNLWYSTYLHVKTCYHIGSNWRFMTSVRNNRISESIFPF